MISAPLNPLEKLAIVMIVIGVGFPVVYGIACLLGRLVGWFLEAVFGPDAAREDPDRPALFPARWLGWQPMLGQPAIALYNLTAEIPGHPVDSTVSQDTLERAGFVVPPYPEPRPPDLPALSMREQARSRHLRSPVYVHGGAVIHPFPKDQP